MSLSVDARHCGAVYVIRCSGRIVAGEESSVLEAAINRGLREFGRLVIGLDGVGQLDSSGIGLLVRCLSHTRGRGGDLRLSAPSKFVASVLRATKLTTVFKVYGSEEEAVVSFLKEPGAPDGEEIPTGPMVLFVDPSPDVCAFVRALLSKSGYSVLSSCRMIDAKLLLLAAKFEYLVLGAECAQSEFAVAAEKLKGQAGDAAIVQLSHGFNYQDPESAGVELLSLLQDPEAARA